MIVKLIDGREVDSASECWRAECEAHAVLQMRTKADRNAYIYGWVEHGERGKPPVKHKGVAGQRGKEAADALKAKVLQLWESGKR